MHTCKKEAYRHISLHFKVIDKNKSGYSWIVFINLDDACSLFGKQTSSGILRISQESQASLFKPQKIAIPGGNSKGDLITLTFLGDFYCFY